VPQRRVGILGLPGQQGPAEALGYVRGDPGDDVAVARGESGGPGLPVQAHHSPARLPGPQRYPQFVAETERPHDGRMPGAAVPVAAGGLIKGPDRVRCGGQVGEPVDVTSAELVGQEGRRRLDERFLADRRGEQQRRGVHGGDEGRVDPDYRLQAGGDLAAQRGGVQAGVAALDERVGPAPEEFGRHNPTVRNRGSG
jgi:hypothetical protein